MRESCSCGAFIQTALYGRVKVWRKDHLHGPDDEVAAKVEPDKQGAIASTERALQFDHDHRRPVTASIGFTPNPAE